jgi:hypothetical protein
VTHQGCSQRHPEFCLPVLVSALTFVFLVMLPRTKVSRFPYGADQCEKMKSCLQFGEREMRSGKDETPKLHRRNARPDMMHISHLGRSLTMLNTERWDSQNSMVLLNYTG